MKKILKILLVIILLQLFRIGFSKLVFLFIDRTVLYNTMANCIYMLVILTIMIVKIKKKKLDLNILPKPFSTIYIILTLLLSLFFITTIIITKNKSFISVFSLIYNSIVTVIFEELLFRGFVWKELEGKKIWGYIISSILFGLWHIGYVDTVMFRTSIFNPTADIVNIMAYKVLTGTVLGFVFGFLRLKTKNTYSSTLLHSLVNIIGS